MGPWIRAGLFCALTLSVAGCFETRQVITLNPDGSGKVVVDTRMTPHGMMMMAATCQEKRPDPDTIAKSMAAGMVQRSAGVDAWSEVSCEISKDGRLRVTGTAYFPDYSKVQIGRPRVMKAKWTQAGQDMVLEAVMDCKEPGDEPAGAAPKALTDGEVDRVLRQKRREWRIARPMMERVYRALKIDTTFVLPGKVSQASVFKKTQRGVQLVIDGGKVLAALDAMVADDAMMKAAIRAGQDPLKPCASDAMLKAVFGGKGPVRATVSGDLKPLFDYKAEASKARAAQPAMLQKLGLDTSPER